MLCTEEHTQWERERATIDSSQSCGHWLKQKINVWPSKWWWWWWPHLNIFALLLRYSGMERLNWIVMIFLFVMATTVRHHSATSRRHSNERHARIFLSFIHKEADVLLLNLLTMLPTTMLNANRWLNHDSTLPEASCLPPISDWISLFSPTTQKWIQRRKANKSGG